MEASCLEALGLKKLSEDELKEVEEDTEKLSSWRTCAVIEAVNWTPWWGGDYRTWVRDPETLEVTSLPTSETIKGALRWVLRAAVNTYLDTDIRTLDQILAPIYGGTIETGKAEEHLDSLVRIIVNVKKKLDDKDVVQKLVSNLISAIKQAVEKCKKIKGKDREKCVIKHWDEWMKSSIYAKLGENKLTNLEKYSKVLTTSRMELSLIKITDLLKMFAEENRVYENEIRKLLGPLLPVPPEHMFIEIKVEISRNFEAMVKKYYANNPPSENVVCMLTLLALIYTLMVKGIGRGANRGFGRFYIKEVKKVKLLDEQSLVELQNIINKLKTDSAEAIKEALEKLHERIVESAKILADLKVVHVGKCEGCSPGLKPINIIHKAGSKVDAIQYAGVHGTSIDVVDGAKHPAPVILKELSGQFSKKPIYDVYDALSAIGRAFMKNVWKKYCKVVNYYVKSSGIGFQSWIAGLPRSQSRAREDKSKRRRIVDTGYVLVRPEFITKIMKEASKSIQSCMLSTSSVVNVCLKREDIVIDFFNPGRRSSCIIAYPAYGKPDTIVVIAYITLKDHLQVLEQLYHVGRHGKPQAPCRHVVKVSWAASRSKIAKPRHGTCLGLGCGSDSHAGIIHPDKLAPITVKNNRDLVLQAFESVLKHIKNVLS